ncbi:DUF1876 domain-containing protein [Dactylosporangium sp. CA-139066]|uniref:DUF1876 domain-containing protein n=1 Tax=Dactylosporangium sp. CA-139066 TaxID=3239930 RepID=UPI003D914956
MRTPAEPHRSGDLDLGAVERMLAGRLGNDGQAALAGQVARLLAQPEPPPTRIARALGRIMQYEGGDVGLIDWLDRFPGRPRLVVRILGLIGLLERYGRQRRVDGVLAGLRDGGRLPARVAGRLAPDTDGATLPGLGREIRLMLAADELVEAGRLARSAARALALVGPSVAGVPGLADLGDLAEASRRDLGDALVALRDIEKGERIVMPTKHWNVDIVIGEDGGRTHAEARLNTEDDMIVTGTGDARLNPADEDIPEIGDELAAARALSDLGHRLLMTASADIEAVTDEPLSIG